MEKKYFGILLILLSFLCFLIGLDYSDREEEKYTLRYPYYKTSNSYSGLVTNKESFINRSGGGVAFNLNDGKGYSLGWAENKKYQPYEISKFLQVGDSITKKAGTDSVLIYRDNNPYYFEVSKRINLNGSYY